MAKNEFIKLGDKIVTKPQGADYDLIPGKVYDLDWDRWNETYIFKENGSLNLPKKIYTTKRDIIFKKRILTYFNNTNTNTTGVMLAGTKGTGKSLMAKVLAKESGLPIIVVNSNYPSCKLIKFFKGFETPVCVIFDEVEKNFQTDKMLDFLDGIEKTAQKLVIMTCNDLSKVSEYMHDRCSRIRYLRKYTPEENIAFLSVLAEDLEIKNKDAVVEYCKNNIKLLSMDNIVSFMREVKMFEDDNFTPEEIIEFMNISTKNSNTTDITETVETIINNDDNDNKTDEDCEDDYYVDVPDPVEDY